MAALMIWSFWKSLPYQSVEKPPQTVTSRDLLKENTIIERIGK